MANNTGKKAKKTAYLLYIPGGAILGCVSLRMLMELEELTGRPARDLFQVFEGVSTGSICISSIMTGHSAKETLDAYIEDGQQFFKPIPHRTLKMTFTNVATFIFTGADPLMNYRYTLNDIIRISNQLMRATPEKYQKDFDNLKKFAKQEVITDGNKKQALKICSRLEQDEEIDSDQKEMIRTIKTYIENIKPVGALTANFYKAARKPVDFVIRNWAGDHYYSSQKPRDAFKKHYGQKRLEDTQKSVYIAAYNIEDSKMEYFYNRKDDLFANDPKAPGKTSSGNEFLWDATMASISSPFAFLPHKTLNNNIYTDQAIVHAPIVSINSLNANKDEDTDIKLVHFGVGRFDQDFIMQEFKRLGVVGRVMNGSMITDIETYSQTMSHQAIGELIGEDNIVTFNPRLKTEEIEKNNLTPNRDTMDASPENTTKLKKIAENYMQQPRIKARMHNLAVELCENLHTLGQMEKSELDAVRARCDHASAYDSATNYQGDQDSPWTGRVRNWFGWGPKQ